MPRVGFEPAIPELDRAATAIGTEVTVLENISQEGSAESKAYKCC
jgi:hypothetical protein